MPPRLTTLKPRLSTLNTNRLPLLGTSGWRVSNMTTADRGYGAQWQQARKRYLRAHPLCVMCQAEGRVTAATVVDHIEPHRGNQAIFWNAANWQSLCASHHSGHKQRIENAAG